MSNNKKYTYGFPYLESFTKLENAPIAKRLFHELWTKAVSQPDYNKKEWQELERILNILLD